jgi:hypothetical protein
VNALRLFSLAVAISLYAQSPITELKMEHDPVKRAEKAVMVAETAFDNARAFYDKGEIEKGDAQLEDMMNALNECVSSLDAAHKAKFYKKPEMKVAYLQRRMSGLLDDLGIQVRGWAEYTQRKLEEVHDKLLEGAMRK